jgi:hypothetical protein
LTDDCGCTVGDRAKQGELDLPRTRSYTLRTSCVKPASHFTPEREITLRWYDALVHLDEAEDGLRMNELVDRTPSARAG